MTSFWDLDLSQSVTQSQSFHLVPAEDHFEKCRGAVAAVAAAGAAASINSVIVPSSSSDGRRLPEPSTAEMKRENDIAAATHKEQDATIG